TGRADAAWRALAARFDRAELHRVTRHAGHVHGVIERDHPAVSEQGADARQGLVIERRVELRLRNVSTQRTTHLHGAQRTTARRTAAVVVQQLTQGQAESALDHAAALDVAGEL